MSDQKPTAITVIISTYNHPEWLQKTLWGYENQTVLPDEIIIADDGSTAETTDMIRDFQENSELTIRHIWQPDEGFMKCRILNKAILEASNDYLLFTDQDCIPRPDFVETHLKHARTGYMLSGGYFKLPMSISKGITRDDIFNQKPFCKKWLTEQGLKCSIKNLKLTKSPRVASVMNRITPANTTFNGCNSSCWKADAIAVNGFNEDMFYGGGDREFGERLFNLGVKPIVVRYSAVCLHLDHGRPYKQPEISARNRAIRLETESKKIIQTRNGIQKL